ncbi:MAG: hypothetical protein LBF22_15385 [Deltaproteobacteria bacterium]|jgi:hypothetical protein|nr:hypothetical protein [Deltaproteobacteria bacterium]
MARVDYGDHGSPADDEIRGKLRTSEWNSPYFNEQDAKVVFPENGNHQPEILG